MASFSWSTEYNVEKSSDDVSSSRFEHGYELIDEGHKVSSENKRDLMVGKLRIGGILTLKEETGLYKV